VVEQDGDFQHESAGQIPCTLGDAQTFLEQSQLRRISMRGVLFVGDDRLAILFSPTHHAADKFHGGILCKLISSAHGVEGYFFLAFPQPLFSMISLKVW
jgi:hypothetical protein